MNRSTRFPAVLCLSAALLGGCGKETGEKPAAAGGDAAAAGATLESDAQKMGYALGASVGREFRDDGIDVDAQALQAGMRDGYGAGELALSEEQIGAAMQQLQQGHMEKQRAAQEQLATRHRTEAEAFLQRNAEAEGVVETDSGLQYKVVTPGEGPKPEAEDTVKVHYRGTLLDGSEFDSSYARGEPVSFPVNAVIPGWVEALQLMPVGSKWQLFIPSDLAYGPGGAGERIPPNALLLFDVELLAIEEAPAGEASE